MKINKLLTKTNYEKSKDRVVDYLVIHYVGAEGTAENNCKYFERFYRGASAHYFIGHSGEVWQCVEDANIAWHCGAAKYKHAHCRNKNSIGIEMCCRKGANGWYFEPSTIAATIDLVRHLMTKYNISIDNVIRHYDVSGKRCPEPYVRNTEDWVAFKNQLTSQGVNKSVEELAREVILGKWGNGSERKQRLTAAGYNYKEIQARVNALLRR